MSDLLIAATSLLEEVKKLQTVDVFLYMEYAEQYSAVLKLAEEEVKAFSEHQLKVDAANLMVNYIDNILEEKRMLVAASNRIWTNQFRKHFTGGNDV